MMLKGLILSRNPHALRLLSASLRKFRIEEDCCSSPQEAIELITRGDYSALVVDFDIPGAAQASKFARTAPPHRRPVIFGIIGASTELASTLQAGVNFPLYKPLDAAQVAHSIRAAYGFMHRDSRRAPRLTVETVVYLFLEKNLAIPTRMVNLSESGLCVQATEALPMFEKVDIHFLLPGSRRAVEGTAELVWSDDSGKAGMFFNELPETAQRFLKEWLDSRLPGQSTSRSQRSEKVSASTSGVFV